jgi:hypothetical protein
MIEGGALPPRDGQGRTVWVTRARPKVDRIACPWLIRRFVDPDAVFLFVAPSEIQAVALGFGATPFDVSGEGCVGRIAASFAPLTPWCRISVLVNGSRWRVWPRLCAGPTPIG